MAACAPSIGESGVSGSVICFSPWAACAVAPIAQSWAGGQTSEDLIVRSAVDGLALRANHIKRFLRALTQGLSGDNLAAAHYARKSHQMKTRVKEAGIVG